MLRHKWFRLTVGLLTLTFTFSSVFAQPAAPVSFPVGEGFADVIPHQIVRTAEDHVYVFAAKAQYTSEIRAYWTEAPGLPNQGVFTGQAAVTAEGEIVSVDAVYDGETMIHVLANTRAGTLVDYPFDTAENAFQPPVTIDGDVPTITGDYIGTSGMSGMVDNEGRLHVAYWSSGDHVTHVSYTYDSAENILSEVDAPTQVDTAGAANHPVIAISPADDSLTVAWVSEAAQPARILARSRTSGGEWGDEAVVSSTPPWASRNFGVNIDQGPSLVIDAQGTRHLAYIEDYDNTGAYGRVHYATQSGDGNWSDEALSLYSHDPALALTDADEVYIIGHGAESIGENINMYTMKQNAGGGWESPQLFASPTTENGSYDASPSVKWSLVGWNRPETIEFIFFEAIDGNYSNTTVYYGRLETGAEQE